MGVYSKRRIFNYESNILASASILLNLIVRKLSHIGSIVAVLDCFDPGSPFCKGFLGAGG